MNVVLKEPQQAFSLANRMLIRIVIVGHVDHGKSTVVGRLLHDTHALCKTSPPPMEHVDAVCSLCTRDITTPEVFTFQHVDPMFPPPITHGTRLPQHANPACHTNIAATPIWSTSDPN